ncbi:protein kinase domain-containing protein [Litorihabitans aurantiacus]|uniref:non-specific serine/threonine protein kinase n=1 Tax=Litorihabitans aurantiacus TaxID=1930061 RepID=A0AA37UVN3_9MICO|nr:protein kinase [Litorihabitans aurantiacus]GMA31296.1 protein kinase [Litorihabitans aurantiacus]
MTRPRTVAGRYELREVLGVGSFATVHRALDDRLEDEVVVKVLAENHSLNPDVRERFIAEGRSLRRVDSPHVVTVHDIGETDRQQPYLVLELADRGTLAARVARLRETGWVASPGDLLAVARALAAALSAVHAAGLVHRDLSPDNVLVTSVPGLERGDGAAPDGPRTVTTSRLAGTTPGPPLVRADERLVLADLGLCKDLAVSSGLTVAGGTAGFRPPEQRSPGTVDHRADLWAASTFVTWLARGSAVPAELEAALRRSLAEDPTRRHPDARAWLADVERALAPPSTRSPGPVGSTTTAPRPRRARRGLLALLLAVATVVGGVGGALVADGPGPRSSTSTAGVAVEGPSRIAVGETVTLTARVDGADSWVWTLPTGEYVSDAAEVTLTPTSAGSARVVLTARDAAGTELRDVHVLTVTG